MSFLDQLTALLPFNKKSETTEYFFAVTIGLTEVTSTVWGLYGKQIDILGQKTLTYSDLEDLTAKTHQALDDSLGALDLEPEKVLFGVPESWSMDDNLKDPYLKLLSKMLKEYDLSPMAYVTTTNSLSYLLQKQEGVPPTAILLGLGSFVEITLVKGGKILGTKSTKRTDILFEDIEKVLQQFIEVEVLPSKILLYSTKAGQDLSKLHSDLMSFPWMAKLSFLHFPKIEILADDILYQSVIFAGASELYPEIDLKHNFSLYQPITPSFEEKSPHVRGFHAMNKSEVNEEGEVEDLGFVKGDIRKELEKQQEESSHASPRKLKKFSAMEAEDLESDNLISPETEEEEMWGEPVEHPKKGKSLINSLGGFFPMQQFFSKIHIPKKFPLKGFLSGKLILILIVLGVTVALYVFLNKAKVEILVEPKLLTKETQVVADPKVKQIDEANKIIPGTIIETTETGTEKGTATGSKQIGDSAKGKVVIRNKTDSGITVAKGTTLTSGSGLKFTLDQSAIISSASSSLTPDGQTTTWGKSDPVGVTAVAIGPESNLTGGTEMIVGSYSKDQLISSVDAALSGGTSKTVTVVTSEDQKMLQAKLTDTLRQKAVTTLQDQSKNGQKVITDAMSVTDGKYSFSKQVNDPASDFTLNATIRFRGTSYLDADLRTIVSKLVVTDIPANYQMSLQDAETQAAVTKVEKDGRLIFNAKFIAKLLPNFNTDEIKKSIIGKSIPDASTKLKEIENVIGSEITLTPALPGPLGRLPLLDQNITITISPK
ncbi:MAG: hypothetical protein WCV81_00580 [Microgenomates group bacterium]|jgi:hypothetical protein